MQNWIHDILEELYLRYGATPTSLNTFIKDKLKINPKDIVRTRHIRDILIDLENRRVITWKVDKKTSENGKEPTYHWKNPEFKKHFGEVVNEEEQTFDNNYVEAHLSADIGLDYAISIVRGKQLHESTLDTNFWMKWLTIVLVSAAVLTLLVQGFQIYRATIIELPKQQEFQQKLQTALDSIRVSDKNKNLILKDLTDSLTKILKATKPK